MIKPGLIAGFVNLIVTFIFTWLTGVLFPSINTEYQNASIFRPWDDPLMMVFFAYPFIAGLALAYLWKLLKTHLKAVSGNKALQFAMIYFLVATIPGMFISYTTFKISLPMVLLWTFNGFLQVLVAGLVFEKLE